MHLISKTFGAYFLTLIWFTSFGVHADIITLSDGTTYTGRILSEQEDSYVLEVQFSKNIKDQKIVKKADLKSVEKEAEDFVHEVNQVTGLVPTADFMVEKDYVKLLRRKISPLLEKDITDTQKKSILSIKKILEHEKERLSKGDVKFKGSWRTPEEQTKMLFRIDSGRLLHQLQESKKKASAIVVLNTFDTFEEEYAASESYEEAIGIALEAINSYLPKVLNAQKTLEMRSKDREENYKSLSVADLRRSRAEIKRQEKLAEERRSEAKENKSKWFVPYSYDTGGLNTIAQNLISEKKRLQTALAKVKERSHDDIAGINYVKFQEAIALDDLDQSKVYYDKCKKLKIPERYLTVLEESFRALERKFQEEGEAEA